MTARYAVWLQILAVRDSNIVAMAALAVGVLLWAVMLHATFTKWFGRALAEPLALAASVVTCYGYIIYSAFK